MTITRQFSLTLETALQIKQDTATPHAKPIPATPTLSRVLAEIGALPREALFLGIASDGLPVLLNLHDPVPGPLLVVADAGAGKTAFLQTLARSLRQTQHPDAVRLGVITNHPDEWVEMNPALQRVPIFSAVENTARDFINFLAGWAHTNRKPNQSILLLIDDLEAVAKFDPDTLQNLRWLLLRGPARRVWPIITMNAERYGQVLSWIPMFRTRIFGRVTREPVATALGGDQTSALNQLEAGIQFSLRENGKWLKFWLPSR